MRNEFFDLSFILQKRRVLTTKAPFTACILQLVTGSMIFFFLGDSERRNDSICHCSPSFDWFCYPFAPFSHSVTKLSPTEFRFSSINFQQSIFLTDLNGFYGMCREKKTMSKWKKENPRSYGSPWFRTIIELASVISPLGVNGCWVKRMRG